MHPDSVSSYYDDYIQEQLRSGINDRIYGLYRRLKKLGLHSGSHVLELGCGIGTMTFLLSKTVKKGRVEAVDISAQSIAFCRQKIKKEHIRFEAADVVQYKPGLSDIDFITLFDVLEHIPAAQHDALFCNIAQMCTGKTKVVINIPNPAYLQYDIDKNAATLQIIDQPLPLPHIVGHLEKHGLNLLFFETYSVWVRHDYQFFVIEKKQPFQEVVLSSQSNFFQKAAKKIERTLVKAWYSY